MIREDTGVVSAPGGAVAEVLVETREKAAALLADLRARAAEHMERMVADSRAAVSEGGRTLRELTTRLNEARIQAEEARLRFEAALTSIRSKPESVAADKPSSGEPARRRLDRLSREADAIATRLETRMREIIARGEEAADRLAGQTRRHIELLQSESASAATAAGGLSVELRELPEKYRREAEEARRTAESCRSEIAAIVDAARQSVVEIRGRLESYLTQAARHTRRIGGQSESLAMRLAQRVEAHRRKIEQAIVGAERTATQLRDQSRSTGSEVRECLEQMLARARGIKSELALAGEDIQEAAEEALGRIERSHATIIETVARAEKGAGEMLKGAESMLMFVRNTAETARSDAALVQRTQAQAREEADAFRNEMGRMRQAIEAAAASARQEAEQLRAELAESRREGAEALRAAMRIGEEARAGAERLVAEARAAADRAQALLLLPQQLIDEAGRRATSLGEMAGKLGRILKDLQAAAADALQKQEQLAQTTAGAGQRLELLRRSTERVGQLAGVIRQLYGTMDARIDKLRRRLLDADDVLRNVPREIEEIHEILREPMPSPSQEEGAAPPARAPGPGRARASSVISARRPATPPVTTPDAGRQKRQRPPLAEKVAIGGPEGSLGALVRRNQKLNAWLREVLGETTNAESAGGTTAPESPAASAAAPPVAATPSGR